MERTGELRIIVQADGHVDPDAGKLAEFITLFRAAYVAALRVEHSADGDLTPTSLASRARKELAALNAAETTKLFEERRKDALRTKRMSHESPLEIVFYGVIISMAAAAILGGGKVTLGPLMKVELARGLPESIKALRDAFAPRTRAQLGYTVQPRTITLNEKEFAELMKQDPAQKDRGTFQRRLVEFQNRMKRRKLTLYPADIDWILKHGSQPEKGGWQASIRKIFWRHFE